MSELFEKNLQLLDFTIADGSLRLVTQINDTSLTAPEIFALEAAREFKADAVYFRRFPEADGRPPLPQIYLYDNTDNQLSDDDQLANIHRDLWSNCRIPMFIVIERTDVAIFDTRKSVTVSDDGTITTTPIDKITLAADAVEKYRRYSRTLFDSGIFWETEKAKGRFLEQRIVSLSS